LKIHVEIKSNHQADVVVENQEQEHAHIDLSLLHHLPVRNDNYFSTTPILPRPPIHMVVPSHNLARETFELDTPASGEMVVHFQSKVTLGNGRTKNGPEFYQVYQVTPQGLKAVSFEEAFLAKRLATMQPGEKSHEAALNLGGNFTAQVTLAPLAFKAHALEPAQASQIQPVRLGSPLEMANKYNLKHLPAISGRVRTSSAEEALNIIPEIENGEGFALEREEDRDLHLQSNFTIKGHMSTKYNDGTFHAAWGWVVTAWQWDAIAGIRIYMPLGWAYVNGDGSWSIPLASFATQSAKVYIQYQTANRFIQLQDPSGRVYTWGDWWSLSGPTTDIGYRFADLSTSGDLPGIDKLYEGATEEWSKLYYNGLNALRDQPIQVTYPNSLATGHCIMNTDASGHSVSPYPWSCSQWADGKIWIIPAHGDKTVVQHEAAHSINSYYWNGNLSSGAGGAHSLDGCYNGGLALTEGFADFMAYWVQFDRASTNPVASYLNENIETYNGDNHCSTGEINEMRVAATFWDMYDTRNDGPDTNHYDGWNYIDQASPVAIYLKNGTKQKMSDYLPIVDAGDPTWFAADRALFRLNRIIN